MFLEDVFGYLVSLTCLDFLSSGLSLSFLELVDRTAWPAADWFITSCAVSIDTWIQQRHTWAPNTSVPLWDVWVMEVKLWPSRCVAWSWVRWADAAGVCGTTAPLWEPAVCALASDAPDARPPAPQTDALQTPRSPLTGQGCDVDVITSDCLYRTQDNHTMKTDQLWTAGRLRPTRPGDGRQSQENVWHTATRQTPAGRPPSATEHQKTEETHRRSVS